MLCSEHVLLNEKGVEHKVFGSIKLQPVRAEIWLVFFQLISNLHWPSGLLIWASVQHADPKVRVWRENVDTLCAVPQLTSVVSGTFFLTTLPYEGLSYCWQLSSTYHWNRAAHPIMWSIWQGLNLVELISSVTGLILGPGKPSSVFH